MRESAKPFDRREFAKLQILRMADLTNAPRQHTPEYAEAVDAFVSGRAEEIEKFVDHWLTISSAFPTRRTIYEHLSPVQQVRFNYGCSRCGWTGFEVLIQYDGVSGARPCSCRATKPAAPAADVKAAASGEQV